MLERALTFFLILVAAQTLAIAAESDTQPDAPPRSGPVQYLDQKEIKTGMTGVAWTVFQGSKVEPIPVEIIGTLKNAWGPRQDIILAKLGGKAAHTNVAGGMSGSPVYINGKLAGAISLRLSTFSPDAICGITPIQSMLEINDFDQTTPEGRRTPESKNATVAGNILTAENRGQSTGASSPLTMIPIATPVSLSGFTEEAVRQIAPVFEQAGMVAAQGGSSGEIKTTALAKDWKTSLQPGASVAAVLVSGDMTISAAGTVTLNDGNRVLALGHPMFNLGAVEMPLAKEDILLTLASAYQPTKMGNASEVVGRLKQDRHSGIAGELGQAAQMIPVALHVRSLDEKGALKRQRDFHLNVFVDQKWTPYLMTATLLNSVSNLNEFSENATYRLTGMVHVDGQQPIQLTTMQTRGAMAAVPTPMLLAGWWGDKFNRLFVNSLKKPKLNAVDATIDLLPERRIAQIESAWIADSRVNAGAEVPVKVVLRPYSGDRMEREVKVKIPAGLPRGEHRILFSDADTLNKFQDAAGTLNQFVDIPQTVSMLNQERSNNRLYVSLIQAQPTVYSEEKILPSLPSSVLNVMQSGRAASQQFISTPESAIEQAKIEFDEVVTGSYSLKIFVN